MSVDAAGDAARDSPTFKPMTAVAVVLVGVFAFCAFAVLGTYAPDLKTGDNGAAHALSRSAVGFAGLAEAVKLSGDPVLVSRQPPPKNRRDGLLVETPPLAAADKDVTPMGFRGPVLVVLPKWLVLPDPAHRGWVVKVEAVPPEMLGDKDTLMSKAGVARRPGISRPVLHAVGAPFAADAAFSEGPVDRLQTTTLKGWGWTPVLVDERGAVVMARAPYGPVYLLSDPDLLNNQGLKSLETLGSGLKMLSALNPGGGPVIFDVTLNGLGRRRSVLRLLFDPPFLAVTLCLTAAAGLAGFQAFCRFGPVHAEGRALALGKEALVDNTAALVRLAGREHRMGGRYADLTRDLAARAVGAPRDLTGDALIAFLDRLSAHRGGRDRLGELTALAAGAPDRGRLEALTMRLFHWRLEMTRERI